MPNRLRFGVCPDKIPSTRVNEGSYQDARGAAQDYKNVTSLIFHKIAAYYYLIHPRNEFSYSLALMEGGIFLAKREKLALLAVCAGLGWPYVVFLAKRPRRKRQVGGGEHEFLKCAAEAQRWYGIEQPQ